MTNKFSCPYCGHDKSTYTSWKSVRGHTSMCASNNHTYVITDLYGPIYYEEFSTQSIEYLHSTYPALNINNCIATFKKYKILPTNFKYSKWSKSKIEEAIRVFFKENNRLPSSNDFVNDIRYPSANTIFRTYGNWKNAILASGLDYKPRPAWDKQSIILAIVDFVHINNSIPKLRDFKYTEGYPDPDTVQRYFGSWNDAIEAAGFEPNIQNGFGINTYGLDGHLYRSAHEAYFVDNYLYGKYDYNIEPKYPSPYSYFYDWYIPSLDLYIELDGGCRPYRTQEKIEINQVKNIKCIFVNTYELYDRVRMLTLLGGNER